MEEKDPITNKFKSAFSDFEREPSAELWKNLLRELHPEPLRDNPRNPIAIFTLFHGRQPGFYYALGGAAFFLFLAVVYLVSGDHYAIRGHAYTGEVRLCRGTAILFKVTDKVMPWDSATHYRTALIDDNGHYQFPKVEPGKYLLRIAPDENSDAAKKFMPSWFDQNGSPDSCHLVIIDNDDVNADVHLLPKAN